MSNPHGYLFVDGSSTRGDDIGAWAAIAVCANAKQVLYGVTFPTTISRCELLPIIEGLRWMKYNWFKASDQYRVTVLSDSETTVKTLCGYYPMQKNEELWAAATEIAKKMQVTFKWRERNTLPYMEMCDALCGGLRSMVISGLTSAYPNPRKLEETIGEPCFPEGIEQ